MVLSPIPTRRRAARNDPHEAPRCGATTFATDYEDGVASSVYFRLASDGHNPLLVERRTKPFHTFRRFFADCFLPEGYPNTVSQVRACKKTVAIDAFVRSWPQAALVLYVTRTIYRTNYGIRAKPSARPLLAL